MGLINICNHTLIWAAIIAAFKGERFPPLWKKAEVDRNGSEVTLQWVGELWLEPETSSFRIYHLSHRPLPLPSRARWLLQFRLSHHRHITLSCTSLALAASVAQDFSIPTLQDNATDQLHSDTCVVEVVWFLIICSSALSHKRHPQNGSFLCNPRLWLSFRLWEGSSKQAYLTWVVGER